jgi:hypothetical protein
MFKFNTIPVVSGRANVAQDKTNKRPTVEKLTVDCLDARDFGPHRSSGTQRWLTK